MNRLVLTLFRITFMLISSFEEKYEFLDLKQKIEESVTKLNEGREDVKLHVKPFSLELKPANRRSGST